MKCHLALEAFTSQSCYILRDMSTIFSTSINTSDSHVRYVYFLHKAALKVKQIHNELAEVYLQSV